MNIYIINALTIINNTYQSMMAFFYQHIIQTQFTNNTLATYNIDYTLLLPSSKYLVNLNQNQVNTQIQAYIDLCNILITYITTNTNTESYYVYEQIQNILNVSIAQINGFSISLLEAEYSSVRVYTVPYTMSMTNVLFLNNINLDTYLTQVTLNTGVTDFNNIYQNTKLNILRG